MGKELKRGVVAEYENRVRCTDEIERRESTWKDESIAFNENIRVGDNSETDRSWTRRFQTAPLPTLSSFWTVL